MSKEGVDRLDYMGWLVDQGADPEKVRLLSLVESCSSKLWIICNKIIIFAKPYAIFFFYSAGCLEDDTDCY